MFLNDLIVIGVDNCDQDARAHDSQLQNDDQVARRECQSNVQNGCPRLPDHEGRAANPKYRSTASGALRDHLRSQVGGFFDHCHVVTEHKLSRRSHPIIIMMEGRWDEDSELSATRGFSDWWFSGQVYTDRVRSLLEGVHLRSPYGVVLRGETTLEERCASTRLIPSEQSGT